MVGDKDALANCQRALEEDACLGFAALISVERCWPNKTLSGVWVIGPECAFANHKRALVQQLCLRVSGLIRIEVREVVEAAQGYAE